MVEMGTIIITGGAGFIGSHLCDYFLARDYKVIAIDNFLTGNPENLPSHPNFTFINADVSERIIDKFPRLRDLEGILHFASPASPKYYHKYPLETMKVNSIGTEKLLYLAWSYNAKFLYASTSEIYGDPLIHPQVEEYYGNVNSIGPRSVYDEAKRYGEAMTMLYHRERKVDTKLIRIFNTYGPRMSIDDGRIVPNLIDQAFSNKPLTIYGDGLQTRSFCYVDDLVNGIYKLFQSDYNLPINVGNDEEVTVLEFAQLIKELTGCTSDIVFEPLPENDPLQRCPNLGKANKILDYKPTILLRDGLTRTIDYFRGRAHQPT
jgi:dTDP-glucose 4,6-dehydratase